ncbi:Threonine/homoserine efflux transporter RhtA [Tistlia consotensis]|uniref:Threonine/homoserine efflux transporter RhtA n=1 Tax=Tistlia consotensis USBA 355 TaxID=560819 RepID=A0A1Y6B336_9PROT|nr:DMT family transporter [Tistlia consotensis]SME87742.1 Threonine/homoserine efflux transporter RhtA [Tistlia consotensis USBA 355]SNR24089.1 Threonine/homoserine efflux transporter RhtA [Tistlia consotensis]
MTGTGTARSVELAPAPAADPALGQLLALISACCFGTITALAALSYREGATPQTVLLLRFGLGALVFAGLCLARRRPLLLPPAARPAAWLTGACWFVASAGYLGSVRFIPVGLAAIIFFTFPILTALGEAALERRAPRPRELALMLLAFTGLALAIGPSFGTLSPLGLALIAAGAGGAAGLFLSMRRIVVEHEPMTVLVQLNLAAGLLCGLTLLALGGWSLPPVPAGAAPGPWTGWIALAVATGGYLVAVFLQSGSVRHAGPSRSALFFNLEPLVTIGGAALLLGERLSLQQAAGGLLVLTALVLAGRRRS